MGWWNNWWWHIRFRNSISSPSGNNSGGLGEKRMSGLIQLIAGIVIMVVGIVISMQPIGSSGNIIFYGAVIFGFILFIKGIINMIRGNW